MAKAVEIQIFGRTTGVYQLHFDNWLTGELTGNANKIEDKINNLARNMAKIVTFLCDKGITTHEEIASLIAFASPKFVDISE